MKAKKKKVWVGYLATNKSGTKVYDFKESKCELEGMLHIFATIRKVRVEEL